VSRAILSVAFPDPALPVPDDEARAHGERVAGALRAAIAAAGGWISFEAYMRFVLYAPGLGYYVAGARKFGAAGDFITAPELTPLFAQSLAVQVRAVLEAAGGDIVELGAGSGALAADLLAALREADRWPARYRILEVSPELRQRQRDTIARRVPGALDRVEWIDDLPPSITGLVMMNEVLDALPVHLVARRSGGWHERGVVVRDGAFGFDDRPLAPGPLAGRAAERFPDEGDYASEINVAAEALIEALAARIDRGALLAIDYGFPRGEYYHPQRAGGTLMGHYRHRAHGDPFLWPGLSDLTAHVDFTAIAEAGVRGGLELAGFTTQAAFLLALGVLDRLAAVGPPAGLAYAREASAVQKLLSPAEMGELFKVLALARGHAIAWPGFALADQRHRL
jgi:SAM-dependent MidA family methyltransferase